MSTALQAIANPSPGQNLDSYIQTVNNIPMLSAEEERALAECRPRSRTARDARGPPCA